MNPQPALDARPRCPHCDLLIELDSGKCWSCKKTPEYWIEQEESMETAVITEAPVELEVGRQATLDPTIFPAVERADVPMVKIGFAGSVEMTQAAFSRYCDEGLEPGRIVKLTLTGYLPNPHAKWVKRSETDGKKKRVWWEQEGAIKVKALELGAFEVFDDVYLEGEED